jgi:hypothetical protein
MRRQVRVGLAVVALLALGGTVGARQGPDGLDPETYEELRRGIDRRYPALTPDARRDALRRIESAPKVRCTIDGVTVYADGIIYRGSVSAGWSADCRLSVLGAALGLIRRARLTDAAGAEWVVPPWRAHYQFAPLTEEWTLLVLRGRRVSFTEVDRREFPRLVPARGEGVRPDVLAYVVTGFGTAYAADLKTHQTVYFVGRGKTPVEWKEEPVPRDARTGVVEAVDRPR